jgi:hypothetical protein
VVANVQSWFTPQPGFISLEHDINGFTSDIAIQVLRAVKAQNQLVLKPQPVATCIGDNNFHYKDPNYVPSATPTPTVGSRNFAYSLSGIFAVMMDFAMLFALA